MSHTKVVALRQTRDTANSICMLALFILMATLYNALGLSNAFPAEHSHFVTAEIILIYVYMGYWMTFGTFTVFLGIYKLCLALKNCCNRGIIHEH